MVVVTPHTGEVSALAWNPNGSLLASVSVDRTIKVWDPLRLAAATPLWERVGHPSEINHAQFSPDGTVLYTCGTEGTIRAWSAADGTALFETDKDDPMTRVGSVNAFILSPDGREIAWGGNMWAESDIVLGRAADLKPVRRLAGHRRPIAIIAAHESGWISGGVDRTVRFWDRGGALLSRSIQLPDIVRGISVSRDGTLLAASAAATLSVWELPAAGASDPAPVPTGRELRGHEGQIESIELSPDGTLLASASLDGTVRVWDPHTGSSRRVFAPGLGPLHWVAFSPDGLTLAFSGHKGHVGLLDVDD